MRQVLLATAAILSLALLAPSGEAATPKGALGALAVSPDGTTVAAAGDNHAFYLVDAATLEVAQRIYLGTNPLEMWYSADGKTLAVFTLDDEVLLLSTADWTVKATLPKVALVTHAAAADALVILGKSQRTDAGMVMPLTVVALADGSVKTEAIVKGEMSAIATRPDAGGFIAISKQFKDEGETKTDTPKDLKGVEKDTFKQQHDGYAAEVLVLDASGAETGRVKSWYSNSSSLTGAFDGKQAWFVVYGNENVALAADGSIVGMFQGPSSYNYGVGVAPGQDRMALGSLRTGGILTLASGAAAPITVNEIPGWPEYFKGFAFAPDGSVFGGTSSFRLIHIGADGKVIGAAPVF